MNHRNISIVLALSSLLIPNCCDSFCTQFDESEDAVIYEATHKIPAPVSVVSLKVFDWSIRYGKR